MSKISELSDGGAIQSGDTLIAVRSGGNVKVTYGGTTTANIDGGTIDGTVIGGSSAAAGSFTTISASGEIAANGGIALGDNDKATFGAGDDLQIYSDGTSSIIQENGTGALYLQGSHLYLNNAAGSSNYLSAIDGGAVTLYSNGSAKLATTATGIDVTGTVTADGLTVSGITALASISGSTSAFLDITATTANTLDRGVTLSYAGSVYGKFATNYTTGQTVLDSGRSGTVGYFLDFNTDGLLRQKINSNGDISFYEDTGTTAKFFWDASAERLGIGTTSPSSTLSVLGTTTQLDVATGASGVTLESINRGNLSAQSDLSLYARNGEFKFFNGAYTERVRIDSSGTLMVGKSATSINTVGHEFHAVGYFRHVRSISTANTDTVGALNRQTTDGAILEFRKDGTTVGSIGSVLGTDLLIGSGASGLRFRDAVVDNIQPYNTNGTSADGNIDLGASTERFKDLYLSGGVYLGGIGADNLLNDYETGTWTPTISVDNFTTTPTTLAGTYVKVGNQVTVTLRLYADGTVIDQTAYCQLGGLPFTCASNTQGGSKGTTNTVSRWFDASISSTNIYVNNMTSGGAATWYATLTYTVA